MKNFKNEIDKRIDRIDEEIYKTREAEDKIEKSISRYEVVKFVSKAAAVVEGTIALGSAYLAASTDQFATYARHVLTTAEKAFYEDAFREGMLSAIPHALIAAGCVGVAYIIGKVIEDKKDDLDLARVSYDNNMRMRSELVRKEIEEQGENNSNVLSSKQISRILETLPTDSHRSTEIEGYSNVEENSKEGDVLNAERISKIDTLSKGGDGFSEIDDFGKVKDVLLPIGEDDKGQDES